MPDSLKTNVHFQRWLTGLALGLPVLLCLAAGPRWSTWVLVGIPALIGIWELHAILFPDPLPLKWLIFSYCLTVAMPAGTYLLGLPGLNMVLFASLFAAFFLMMMSSPRDPEEIRHIAYLVLAWLYVPYLLSFALLVRDFPGGRFWTIFVLGVIIAGDAGAYYTGLNFGRRKLLEPVSPKKTVEGSLGGLAASILMGLLLWVAFYRQGGLVHVILFSFFIAIAGQIGDLFESMIKRNCGKKDSSSILPGHGGILDRLDSILFSYPLMWLLLQWFA